MFVVFFPTFFLLVVGACEENKPQKQQSQQQQQNEEEKKQEEKEKFNPKELLEVSELEGQQLVSDHAVNWPFLCILFYTCAVVRWQSRWRKLSSSSSPFSCSPGGGSSLICWRTPFTLADVRTTSMEEEQGH